LIRFFWLKLALGQGKHNERLNLTGAAILVFRASTFLQAGSLAEP